MNWGETSGIVCGFDDIRDMCQCVHAETRKKQDRQVTKGWLTEFSRVHRSFMVLWLLGLPFTFLKTLGYYTIIVCTIVGYGEFTVSSSSWSTRLTTWEFEVFVSFCQLPMPLVIKAFKLAKHMHLEYIRSFRYKLWSPLGIIAKTVTCIRIL